MGCRKEYNRKGREIMITKRKLNKKLDTILARQNFMFELYITAGDYDKKNIEKAAKKWNSFWYKFMDGKDG